MDALQNLGIDFKVLLAQTVNFGIVLFLLTKFLYKPIIHTLESRKKKIETGLKNAEEADLKLQVAETEYFQTLEKAKHETIKILEVARANAEKDRQKILAAAEREAESIRVLAREALEAERQKMSQEMKQKIGELSLFVIEKVLKMDLGESFQQKQLEKALQEVRSI